VANGLTDARYLLMIGGMIDLNGLSINLKQMFEIIILVRSMLWSIEHHDLFSLLRFHIGDFQLCMACSGSDFIPHDLTSQWVIW
jgi:hypothetical protein